MTVRNLITLFACLPCICHGRRVLTSSTQFQAQQLVQSHRSDDSENTHSGLTPLKTLAEFILGLDDTAAFNMAGTRLRFSTRNQNLMKGRLATLPAVMQEDIVTEEIEDADAFLESLGMFEEAEKVREMQKQLVEQEEAEAATDAEAPATESTATSKDILATDDMYDNVAEIPASEEDDEELDLEDDEDLEPEGSAETIEIDSELVEDTTWKPLTAGEESEPQDTEGIIDIEGSVTEDGSWAPLTTEEEAKAMKDRISAGKMTFDDFLKQLDAIHKESTAEMTDQQKAEFEAGKKRAAIYPDFVKVLLPDEKDQPDLLLEEYFEVTRKGYSTAPRIARVAEASKKSVNEVLQFILEFSAMRAGLAKLAQGQALDNVIQDMQQQKSDSGMVPSDLSRKARRDMKKRRSKETERIKQKQNH